MEGRRLVYQFGPRSSGWHDLNVDSAGHMTDQMICHMTDNILDHMTKTSNHVTDNLIDTVSSSIVSYMDDIINSGNPSGDCVEYNSYVTWDVDMQ